MREADGTLGRVFGVVLPALPDLGRKGLGRKAGRVLVRCRRGPLKGAG